MSGHTEFEAERSSKTDKLLLDNVVEPLWRLIPSHVTPNTITLITPVLAGTAFILAATAPHLSPLAGMWARIVAGVMMFGTMLTDHLKPTSGHPLYTHPSRLVARRSLPPTSHAIIRNADMTDNKVLSIMS